MSLENFDLESFAQQLTAHFENQLASAGLPPEEAAENVNIIEQFNSIAIGLLREEPGISLPGSEQMIPWDEKTTVQGLTLFAEGIYLGMLKCFQQGIPSDLKKKLLQEFAMDVYTQAKHVVASTYGQEHTPEFQLSHEQQVALINQAASNALMFYINKHEEEFGPIEAGPIPINPIALPTTTSELVKQDASSLPEPIDPAPVEPMVPPAAVVPAPLPPPLPARPQAPTPQDKYGAVALLLSTLPASQRSNVLRPFSEEEKERIAFYSDARQIEQNLYLPGVESHLKRLKALFKQGNTRKHTQSELAQLASQHPLEALLPYVKDERPIVKQAIEAMYHPPGEHPLLSLVHKQGRVRDVLPSRIEEILCRHLQRRLEASPQQRA